MLIPTRRFGRTGLDIPVLSVGGMRFQQSWKEIDESEISDESQNNLDDIVKTAASLGLHHLETARCYGTSELQLGRVFREFQDSHRILQTKIAPKEDAQEFELDLELSFQRLQCERIDLVALHGINLPEHLERTIRPGGCLEVIRRWQKDGRIGHVGFSTHGSNELIVNALRTEEFDYVNLHWYFINQKNDIALKIANELDLGVFIISPTDKGGHLHSPSSKLTSLCSPFHPIIFNDLFCLRDHRVHTISVGLEKLSDLKLHFEALELLQEADEIVPLIQERLMSAAMTSLGTSWMTSWDKGLPKWNETPGEMNISVLLWLSNLLEAWDMESFAKDRYGLLGRGGHWFPGSNADALDREVSEESLREVLVESPWSNEIPGKIRALRDRIGGVRRDRLWGI